MDPVTATATISEGKTVYDIDVVLSNGDKYHYEEAATDKASAATQVLAQIKADFDAQTAAIQALPTA